MFKGNLKEKEEGISKGNEIPQVFPFRETWIYATLIHIVKRHKEKGKDIDRRVGRWYKER